MPCNRLMPVLHECGIKLRLADSEGLNRRSGGRRRGRLKQRCQAPVGNPRQSFNLFIVSEDDIFTGGLNALQAPKGEGIGE